MKLFAFSPISGCGTLARFSATSDGLAASGSVLNPHVSVNSPPEAVTSEILTFSFFHFCTQVMRGYLKLDGVLGTQTSRLLLSYYSSRSHGTVVCTTCKERNYCRPRDPASWPNMAATADDCERTATLALPTAPSPGFISGEVGISAALDAFSTVYELPLTSFN